MKRQIDYIIREKRRKGRDRKRSLLSARDRRMKRDTDFSKRRKRLREESIKRRKD